MPPDHSDPGEVIQSLSSADQPMAQAGEELWTENAMSQFLNERKHGGKRNEKKKKKRMHGQAVNA